MTTEAQDISVAGLPVWIVRKRIKHLHVGVHPPDGVVRVAAPDALTDDAVRLAVIDKLGWIRKQQAKFAAQPRQSAREMVTGETHYVFGRACRLFLVEHQGPARFSLRRKNELLLHARPSLTVEQRHGAIQEWYRAQLKELVPPMVAKWGRDVGVDVRDARIKRMKTRWGTCNVEARRIWVNLELAKKPVRCLEYIVAHEVMHLVERTHGPKFIALMERHMPRWRAHRDELNAGPLAHEDWSY